MKVVMSAPYFRADTHMSLEEVKYLRAENERLRAALVSIGILNASGGHFDQEIDKVIREVAAHK